MRKKAIIILAVLTTTIVVFNLVSVPAEKPVKSEEIAMEKENPGSETAILAGGCFWGMEEVIRKIPGVIKTKVNGKKETPLKTSRHCSMMLPKNAAPNPLSIMNTGTIKKRGFIST